LKGKFAARKAIIPNLPFLFRALHADIAIYYKFSVCQALLDLKSGKQSGTLTRKNDKPNTDI
jgi:hypothetical protein